MSTRVWSCQTLTLLLRDCESFLLILDKILHYKTALLEALETNHDTISSVNDATLSPLSASITSSYPPAGPTLSASSKTFKNEKDKDKDGGGDVGGTSSTSSFDAQRVIRFFNSIQDLYTWHCHERTVLAEWLSVEDIGVVFIRRSGDQRQGLSDIEALYVECLPFYQSYVSKLEAIFRTLSYMQSNVILAVTMTEVQTMHEGMYAENVENLSTLLTYPANRPSANKLFLKQLVHDAPTGNTLVSSTFLRMSRRWDDIVKLTRQHGGIYDLLHIQKSVGGTVGGIVKSGRYLIKEGRCALIQRDGRGLIDDTLLLSSRDHYIQVQVYLFNDMILILQHDGVIFFTPRSSLHCRNERAYQSINNLFWLVGGVGGDTASTNLSSEVLLSSTTTGEREVWMRLCSNPNDGKYGKFWNVPLVVNMFRSGGGDVTNHPSSTSIYPSSTLAEKNAGGMFLSSLHKSDGNHRGKHENQSLSKSPNLFPSQPPSQSPSQAPSQPPSQAPSQPPSQPSGRNRSESTIHIRNAATNTLMALTSVDEGLDDAIATTSTDIKSSSVKPSVNATGTSSVGIRVITFASKLREKRVMGTVASASDALGKQSLFEGNSPTATTATTITPSTISLSKSNNHDETTSHLPLIPSPSTISDMQDIELQRISLVEEFLKEESSYSTSLSFLRDYIYYPMRVRSENYNIKHNNGIGGGSNSSSNNSHYLNSILSSDTISETLIQELFSDYELLTFIEEKFIRSLRQEVLKSKKRNSGTISSSVMNASMMDEKASMSTTTHHPSSNNAIDGISLRIGGLFERFSHYAYITRDIIEAKLPIALSLLETMQRDNQNCLSSQSLSIILNILDKAFNSRIGIAIKKNLNYFECIAALLKTPKKRLYDIYVNFLYKLLIITPQNHPDFNHLTITYNNIRVILKESRCTDNGCELRREECYYDGVITKKGSVDASAMNRSMSPLSTHPSSTHPSSTHPSSTHPSSTHPSSTHPSSTPTHPSSMSSSHDRSRSERVFNALWHTSLHYIETLKVIYRGFMSPLRGALAIDRIERSDTIRKRRGTLATPLFHGAPPVLENIDNLLDLFNQFDEVYGLAIVMREMLHDIKHGICLHADMNPSLLNQNTKESSPAVCGISHTWSYVGSMFKPLLPVISSVFEVYVQMLVSALQDLSSALYDVPQFIQFLYQFEQLEHSANQSLLSISTSVSSTHMPRSGSFRVGLTDFHGKDIANMLVRPLLRVREYHQMLSDLSIAMSQETASTPTNDIINIEILLSCVHKLSEISSTLAKLQSGDVHNLLKMWSVQHSMLYSNLMDTLTTTPLDAGDVDTLCPPLVHFERRYLREGAMFVVSNELGLKYYNEEERQDVDMRVFLFSDMIIVGEWEETTVDGFINLYLKFKGTIELRFANAIDIPHRQAILISTTGTEIKINDDKPISNIKNSSILKLASKNLGYFLFFDDCDSRRQAWLRDFERVISALRTKLVLKGERVIPIFGAPLPLICSNNGCDNKIQYTIPLVVLSTCDYLLRVCKTDGLFRVSGDHIRIRQLRNMFNRGDSYYFDVIKDSPYDVAGLLKLYLREMSDPLLTHERYSRYIEAWIATSHAAGDEKFNQLQSIVLSLPIPNLLIVQKLFTMLLYISKYKDVTRMDAKNLSICIAPNILRPEIETRETLVGHSSIVNDIVEFYILYSEELNINIQKIIDRYCMDSGRTKSPLSETYQLKSNPSPSLY